MAHERQQLMLRQVASGSAEGQMINRCTPQVAAAALLSPPMRPPSIPSLFAATSKTARSCLWKSPSACCPRPYSTHPTGTSSSTVSPATWTTSTAGSTQSATNATCAPPPPPAPPPAHAAAGAGAVCAALHLSPERHGTTLEAQAPPPTFFRCRCPSKFCRSCCLPFTARARA